jgi:type IV pilus assembly protein PilA
MMNNKSKKGFTLVEIMIVLVIIGLLAAIAFPAFQKVRSTSQNKAIANNLRQLAGAAQQYILESGSPTAPYAQLIGSGLYIASLETVAGEAYTGIAIDVNTTQISATKSDGTVVNYTF